MNLERARDLKLGAWLVEPSLLRVRRGEETVRLEPKTMQVLLCLAERHGEVVAKEHLHREVWDGAYAAEDGLRRAILQLRRLFGDEAKAPGVIETVPRLGYRLLLEPVPVSSPRAVGASLEAGSARQRANGRLWVPALAAALAVALAVAWFAGPRGSSARHETPHLGSSLEVVPLTSYPGLEFSPSFAPDGNRLVFVWEREAEGVDLFVRRLDGETPMQLTRHPGREGDPAWSPDGRWIAFSRRSPEATELLLVPPLGGGERLLTRLAPAPVHGLCWAPDSGSILFAHGPTNGVPSTLYRIAIDSLDITAVTSPPAGMNGDRRPVISPDGERVAFVRSAVHGLDDIYLAELASMPEAAPHRLTRLQRKITDLAWEPGGGALLTAQLHGFRYGIWRVPLEAPQPEEIALGEDNAFQLALSPRGDRFAYARERYDSNILRFSLTHLDPAGEPFISSTHVDYGPDVSPEDGRIAFLSKRSGAPEVWVSAADGGDPHRLTQFGGAYVGHARWAPSGGAIVFDARGDGNADIYTVSSAGEIPRRLTTAAAEDVAPSWSRDGRWVYFASNRSGEWQVWKLPAAGGEPVQVTNSGGFHAAESLDGRFLLYAKMHRSGLYRLPIEGGEETLFVPHLSGGAWGNWVETPDGLILLTDGLDGGWDVARVRGEGEAVERLLHLENWPPNPGLAVHGDTLLLARVENVEGDLMLARPLGSDGRGSRLTARAP